MLVLSWRLAMRGRHHELVYLKQDFNSLVQVNILPSLTSIVLCTDFVNDDIKVGALHRTREHYPFESPDFGVFFVGVRVVLLYSMLFLLVLCITFICFVALNFDIWTVLNKYVPFTILKLVYRYFSNSWKNKLPNYFDFDLFVWNFKLSVNKSINFLAVSPLRSKTTKGVSVGWVGRIKYTTNSNNGN